MTNATTSNNLLQNVICLGLLKAFSWILHAKIGEDIVEIQNNSGKVSRTCDQICTTIFIAVITDYFDTDK